jgi:BlaI family penicillinase repressor
VDSAIQGGREPSFISDPTLWRLIEWIASAASSDAAFQKNSIRIVYKYRRSSYIGGCPEKSLFLVAGKSMSLAQRKALSKAEWKVMRIVWELQKAMAREVYTIAGEKHSWTPATVKTILKRLVDKGYLSTTQVGNGFVYRPAGSAFSALQAAADVLLDNTIEGTTGPLLAHMVEQTSLSEADLDALQKLIDAKKQSLSKPRHKQTSDRAGRRR